FIIFLHTIKAITVAIAASVSVRHEHSERIVVKNYFTPISEILNSNSRKPKKGEIWTKSTLFICKNVFQIYNFFTSAFKKSGFY
ncbi:MAG: hypothetical protein LDL23_11555, partial [Flavobacterium sp.]|nr:hypothetical protein [Flavobacterium sp.]